MRYAFVLLFLLLLLGCSNKISCSVERVVKEGKLVKIYYNACGDVKLYINGSEIHPLYAENNVAVFNVSSIDDAVFYACGCKVNLSSFSLLEEARVVRVIDGDTFVIDSGERVRLIGINAPERGHRCYEEAKEELEKLVLGKKVMLEKGKRDRDVYGRLLRYVFVNNTFVNYELVRRGYATPYFIEKDEKYRDSILLAEKVARSKKAGCLWKDSENPCKSCIKLVELHYDARGNDCINTNDEYVVLENTCNFMCDLTGWIVKDESKNMFVFPAFKLKPHRRVYIYTGCGVSNETALFWCVTGRKCNAVWNNNGDTLYLMDRDEKIVLVYRY